MQVSLPPLRDRVDDIPLLVEHFIRELAQGRRFRVRPDDVALLQRASWPGNVRELRNLVERALAMATTDCLDLAAAMGSAMAIASPPALSPPAAGTPFRTARDQVLGGFERDYLIDLLRRHGGNLSSAAREAQIDRKYLRDLLKRHRLRDPDPT
jgi:DNA-binding NtrC family response regulator